MVKDKKSKSSKRVNKRRGTEFDAVSASVQRMYDKSAPLLLAEGLLIGIVALFMVFKPLAILATLTVVVGVGLILFGLYRTIVGFVSSRNYGGGWVDVVFGVVNVILGVLFCVYPGSSMVALMYVFLILFIFKAIRSLVFAINMARAKFGHWGFDLFVAILMLVLSVALLFWPMAGAVAIVYWLAAMMLMYSAVDVYMFIELTRLKNKVLD